MLGNLIGITVFLALMLLCRRLWKGRISRRLQYSLWLLAALRLLMPVGILENPLLTWEPAAELWRQADGDLDQQAARVPVYTSPSEGTAKEEKQEKAEKEAMKPVPSASGESQPLTDAKPSSEAGPSFALPGAADLAAMCRRIWILGMGVTAAWILAGAVLFRLRAGQNRRLLGKEGRVRIYESEGLDTPCLCAGFPPVIYLTPESLATETRYRHILTHELTHYRHGDHIWCLVRSLCTVIYWFHPLVWAAGRAWALDCEQACDEGVIARLGEAERKGYGHTLIEMMTGAAPAFHLPHCTTGVAEGKRAMRERLVSLAAKRRKFGGMAVAAILTALLLTACSISGNTEKQGEAGVGGTESEDWLGAAGGPESENGPGMAGGLESENGPGTTGRSESPDGPGTAGGPESPDGLGTAGGPESEDKPGAAGGTESEDKPGAAGGPESPDEPGTAGGTESIDKLGSLNGAESGAGSDSAESARMPGREEEQILGGFLLVDGDREAAEKVTWELDLNLDGTREEIVLENLSPVLEGQEPETFGDCRIQAGESALEFYGSSVAPELMGFSPDGKTILLAVYDDGPSGDPWTRFFRYDGITLREAGGLSGDLRTLTGEDGESLNASSGRGQKGDLSTVVYQQRDGSLRTSFRADVLQTQLAWGYWIWNGESLELRQDEEYEYLTYGEGDWFTLLEPLTVYETKSEAGTGAAMNPQRVRCTRTDGQNWVCLEAEDGTRGWLFLENGEIPSMGNRWADELFEGLSHAD